MASEVWLLGAVLYHMMVGRPPLETQKELAPLAPDGTKPSDILVQALPTKYSSELREIVTEMLRTRTQERPTTPELSLSVDRGMRIWCESTPEGRLYVRKGQRKGNSGLVPREALSLGRLR